MARYVDRKTVAQVLGVSRQRLEKLIKDGRITETDKGIDLAKAKRDYEASIDPAKRAAYLARDDAKPKQLVLAVDNGPKSGDKPAAEPQSGTFNAARAQREQWNALKAELDYKQRAGELISREEVRAKEFAVARKLRDRILGFPARLANFVPNEAMKIITDECDQLIRELQEDAASIAEERSL